MKLAGTVWEYFYESSKQLHNYAVTPKREANRNHIVVVTLQFKHDDDQTLFALIKPLSCNM